MNAGREINTVNLAMTDADIERGFAAGGIGVHLVATDGCFSFETTQPEARCNTDLQVGDRVILVAMGDNGALGKGSTYIADITDLDDEPGGIAWLEGR
jgi:hypothetical protein